MRTRTVERILALTLFAGWILGGVQDARAHGELDEMITNTTRQIALNPRDPNLYLLRAELHRSHRGWDAACADLDRANTLSNQWQFLHLARARVFLDAEWFESAKVAADRFLTVNPTHVEGLVTRARAQVKLGERVAAAADYTLAIRSAAEPTPELYLERAQALTGAGGEHLADALQGLEEGLRKLGPLLTLESAAIEIEVQQNRVDAALARLDQLMTRIPRKETWLTRRGDILRRAGRNPEAVAAFQAALQALDTLPRARRNVPVNVELDKRIRAALAELGAAPGPSAGGAR